MPEFIEILIISIVQGIGEFLPISSSGHLAVTNHLFERFGVPLTTSEGDGDFIKLAVFLHVGTLLAVVVVFWRRILDLFGKDRRLIPLLIIGTIPAVIFGLGLKRLAPADFFENLYLVAACFPMTAMLLFFSMKHQGGEKNCSEMTWIDALVIGMVQAVAVLPGISRSGSTIVAGGLFQKLRREEAATVSFLLSIPVIGGGGILEFKDLLEQEPSEQGISNGILLTGMTISCVVGVVALVWLLDWLKKGKLWHFAAWLLVMCPVTFALAALPMSSELKSVSIFVPPTCHAVDSNVEEHDLPSSFPMEGAGNANYLASASDVEEAEEIAAEPKKLSREEAQREYERILAEEEAREQALIDEENKRIPFVDEPEKLILLSPKDRIWLTPDRKSVVLLGRVSLREGPLELFACRIGTKEHESVISVRVTPFLIHAALLAAGAEPGKPVQFDPEFVPPSGDEIEIKVRWKDDNQDAERKWHEVPAQDWIWDMANSGTKNNVVAKKSMSSHWVFTGSMTYKDESGREHYVADGSGELFGLSNFVGAILDIPVKSSADNANLMFGCFTERIPELATPVTLILTPVKTAK